MKRFMVAVAFIFATIIVGVNCHKVDAQSTKTFKDVKGSTEIGKAIYSMVEKGILSGYPDGTFKPNQPVTNAQAAKMVAGALNFTYDELPEPYYKDIPATHSNYKYIMTLLETGIFQSKTAYQFKPNDKLTRIHMAEILTRAYHLPSPTDSKQNLPFTDLKTDSDRNIVAPLYFNGITKGTSDTTYGKNNPVTRGQFATFIYRIEQKIASGELKGRQPVLNAFMSNTFSLVELKDESGTVISPELYEYRAYLPSTNILIYEYGHLGQYVATFKDESGSTYEMAIQTDYYNNNFTNYSGKLQKTNQFHYRLDEIQADLNEQQVGSFELMAIDATQAQAIHPNYTTTLEVDALINEKNSAPQFTVLKEGRTIIQYTYKVDGVVKTKNVYYATGLIGDRAFISKIKTSK